MATCPTCRVHYEDGILVCPADGEVVLPDQAFIAAEKPLEPGSMVAEYRIEEVVGEGGFGTVYRAVQPLIGKSVAVKVLKREFSANPEMVSRFIAEARAVNQIRHRNIIDIFGFGVLDDGRHFCVMELLEGTSLDRYKQERGRLAPGEALVILRQLARALAAAHAAGVTHRDLKPDNVFLTFDDEGQPTAKLLDFGIAKLLGGPQGVHKTRSGAPMGTPLYMSPEQVFGRSIDHRSDIYSFGILAHELLTGAPPFDGETVMDVLTAQTTATAPTLSSLVPSLGTALDAPLSRLLAKDPEARPQSMTLAMDSLIEAAEQAGHLPRRSKPSSSSRDPVDLVRRNLEDVATLPIGATSSAPPVVRGSSSIPTPGDAATLRSAKAATLALEDAPTRGNRSRAVWIGAAVAAACVLVGAGVVASGRASGPVPGADQASGGAPALVSASPASGTQAPSATPLAAATATANGSASANAPEVTAARVKVVLEGADEAEVFLDGERLGTTSTPVELPRSERKVKLTVRRSGFTPREVWVVPTRDQTVKAPLTRVGAQPRHRDLEF